MIALSLFLTVGALLSVWADHNRRNPVRLTTLEKEQELRETKVQLQQITGDPRTLISALDEGLAVCEMIYDESGTADDCRILEVNKGYEKQTGFKQESVRGKTAREQIHATRDLGDS
jgi:PAS domain-containing protein